MDEVFRFWNSLVMADTQKDLTTSLDIFGENTSDVCMTKCKQEKKNSKTTVDNIMLKRKRKQLFDFKCK